MPSAWQKRMEPEEGDFDFELAIVGGGVGGAYLVNRLHEEFVIKRGQAMPNIALFERSDKMGGRLMSGYGAGALNLGVQPMSKPLYDKPKPMPEYGGMRVDPRRYPLVMNRIAYFSRILFGAGTCPTPGCDFQNKSETRNCCKKMLRKMAVGDVRYVTTDPDASALMKSSTISINSSIVGKPLSLADIASLSPFGSLPPFNGSLSPFDQCRLLVVAADAYYNVTDKERDPKVKVNVQKPPRDGRWSTAMNDLCNDCNTSGIVGMCILCGNFVNAGEYTAAGAAASCTGYDFSGNVSLKSIIDLAEEVVDITRSSNLYLLNVGFQR